MTTTLLTFFVRLALILALSLGLASATTSTFAIASLVAANGEEDDKDDEGNKEDDDKDEEKDKGKDEDKDGVDVRPAGNYRVEVECEYDDLTDSTTCEFSAPTPAGEKKVTHITVPGETVCAPVEGGDTEFHDPDPNTKVTGYTTRGGDPTLTLVLEGEVSTEGQVVYWLKSEGSVMPARGDRLQCSQLAAEAEATQPAVTPTPVRLTPDVSDSTGAILVVTYACPIAEATPEYDWFAECSRATGGMRFRLISLEDDAATGKTGAASETGEVQFGSLEPGLYELTRTDANWCHAKSDDVDADGNVIVSAGEQTTVWVFACADATTTPTPAP